MTTSVTFNGTSYSVPAAGELNWSSLSAFMVDVGNNAATMNKMKQTVRTATTTPVTVVAATDFVVMTSLAAPGAVAVNLPAGVDGQIFIIKDLLGDALTNNITITPNGAETISGAANLVLNHNSQCVIIQYKATGTDWKVLINGLLPGTISNADVSATAAIARSKLASGTAYRILANTSAGVMSENAALTANYPVIADANGQLQTEQYLAGTRGGTGITSTATFPASGTVATIAGVQQLTNKDIDGGTASDTLRITLPKAATATLAGLTRKEGTIVFDSTTKVAKLDNGTTLDVLASTVEATASVAGIVGIGAQTFGGVKYFSSGLSGYGASNVETLGGSGKTLLSTDLDIQILTPTAVESIDLPSTNIKKGRLFSITNGFTHDGTFTKLLTLKSSDGDVIATIYPGSTVRVSALQDTPTDKTHWKSLDTIISPIFKISEATDLSGLLNWDLANDNANAAMAWRRVGKYVHIEFHYHCNGAVRAGRACHFTLPYSWAIDTGYLSAGAAALGRKIGDVEIYVSASGATYCGEVIYENTTRINAYYNDVAGTIINSNNVINDAAPITFASGDNVFFHDLWIPLSTWTETTNT